MEKDIDSKFNACMYREYCRGLQAKLEAAEEMARVVEAVNFAIDFDQLTRTDKAWQGLKEECVTALSAWEKAGAGNLLGS